MSGPRITLKWRPSLGLIVFSVLLTVLALPASVVIWFQALDNTGSRMGPIELGALLVALVLTIGIAFVLTRTITLPIAALVLRAREIGTGGRAAIQPLDTYGTSEIATLAQAFFDLAARLVDRSDYVQSFAAHVSHELKSPLTAIRGAAELLRDAEMTPEERRRFLDHIVADADRLDGLLVRLRELARAELPMSGGHTSLAAIAADLSARFPSLTVEFDRETNPGIALSPEVAAIVFGHLADNSLQHGATQLTLSAAANANAVSIVAADNGRGISPGNRALVFQPFFSTRRAEGGTGMGLDIARAMLEAHGASIALIQGQVGAAFEITVPTG
ncbi:MAG: sensor histidine kinase protein [Devosia sp.]|nr:sensor histidine kinase protein [Devosia sp.]